MGKRCRNLLRSQISGKTVWDTSNPDQPGNCVYQAIVSDNGEAIAHDKWGESCTWVGDASIIIGIRISN